jgi:hypothetical protein
LMTQGADFVVADLSELTVDKLDRLIGSKRGGKKPPRP